MAPEAALERVVCNLCGCDDAARLYERPYDLASVSEVATFAATTDEYQSYGRIVRCRRCGLVYTNPRPKAPDLIEGYKGCVDEAYMAESSSRSINAHLSLNVIKRFVKGGKLLEVGSYAGYFLNAARTDFEVSGLEPSEWGCRMTRERFGIEAHQEPFETTKRFAPGSLDCVAMIDVIEHLADPMRALERANSLLKPGGILYLVTPDIGSFSALLLGGGWWGLRPAHIYYFDKRTLRDMLGKSGFDVVHQRSFGRVFSYGYWASRLRHYPAWARGPVEAVIRWLELEHKLVYVDTRDSIEICARKRP